MGVYELVPTNCTPERYYVNEYAMIFKMKKVILCGVCIKDDTLFESKMAECKELCLACGYEVVDTMIQNLDSMDVRHAFRTGKLEELRNLVSYHDVDLVIFYNALSVKQAQRISEIVECRVIDRTALILDIFTLRARTKQAKLQTEMARLQYDLPRILNSDNDTERERGGSVNNRGSGEMRSAIVSRKYKKRIQELKLELSKIDKRLQQDERRREKTLIKRVALVGYTNAGKSSFMNVLLKKEHNVGTEVYQEDMLFATLDTSVRNIEYKKKNFLLYDTVGFVSDLPHMLVEAFKSTLDAARGADLLIHVIDASDKEWERKEEVTLDTLNEIGAGDIPVLKVFNKVDLVEDVSNLNGLCISCLKEEGIEETLDKTINLLYPREESVLCKIPYDKIYMFDEYRSVMDINILQDEDDGQLINVSGPKEYIHAFDMYRLEGINKNE